MVPLPVNIPPQLSPLRAPPRRRRWRSIAAWCGLWIGLQATGAPGKSAAAPAGNRGAPEIAREVIEKLGLQADLPRGAETAPWQWHLHLPTEIADILLLLLISIALLLVVLFLAHARGDLFSIWRGSREAVAPLSGAETDPGAAAEVTAAADDLARQGRFVEAMHALLLQGLAEIRQRIGDRFADSLTSREILRGARLSDRGRSSLRDIIARVEWTYFGENPADAADYAACRNNFGILAAALREDAPA
jgi:hypothetical protein